jgi:hypothetical protein
VQKPSYVEQAAEALELALRTSNHGEQGALLDKALRLNRFAVAEETAKLAKIGTWIAGPEEQQAAQQMQTGLWAPPREGCLVARASALRPPKGTVLGRPIPSA